MPEPGSLRVLMRQLHDRGVKLWLDGERLRVRAPSEVLTHELQSMLATRKPEIISFLLDNTTAAALPTVEDDGELSAGQRSIWFQHHLLADKALYNVYAQLHLRGALDVECLRVSFDRVIARHEALRTRFPEIEGAPRRIVDPPWTLALPTYDLRGASDPAAALERLRHELTHAPFDLATGPLVRAGLARMAEDESHLFLVQHHVMIDGWSMAILLSELIEGYRLLVSGELSPPRPPPRSMASCLALTRLTPPEHARHAAVWQERLRELPSLRLPADGPIPAAPSTRGATLRFSLDAALTARIHELSARCDCTLFVTLLAAFAVLLHRTSGQRSFGIGTVVANRGRAELHDVIGCFINTLLLRCDVDDRVSFRELVHQLRDMVLDAFEHQELPFDEVVRGMRVGNERLASEPIQACFLLENIAMPTVSFGEVVCTSVLRTLDGSLEDTAKFDVMLAIAPAGGELDGALQYRSELYREDTARRMIDHFRQILESVVADPDVAVARVSWLPAAERDALIALSTGPVVPLPVGTACELFAEQVARTPEAFAAVWAGERATYRTLDERSNDVAHRLAACGVGPDHVVPILAHRDLEFLITILGVLKAGGAYLPVDTRQPERRMAHVLQQAGAPLVVVGDEWLEIADRAIALLPGEMRPRCERLSSLREPAGNGRALGPRARAQDLAYVLFTSGSTGTPKGAMIEHRGLLNHLLVMNELLALGPDDCLAQTAHQCFDVSVWQLLSPLLAGATVAIVPDDVVRDPRRFVAELHAHRVTVAQLVPSQVQALLDEVEQRPAARDDLAQLRWLSVSGEALPPELTRRWFQQFPGVPLVNAYGPAECSDDVSLHVLREPLDRSVVHAPIGRPIRNLRLYVVDALLEPVPIGVPGELCVAGVGVGRGYLHDEARTRERFIPDPISGGEGERLYRTGDLARWLPDGELEFLGRIDHQVKLRGIRIELGEIEAAAEDHDSVAQCVATVANPGTRDARLVAFLVPRGAPPEASAVRSFLLSRLPEAMVPSQLVFVEALPLSPNGKVDRAALVVPQRDHGERARTPARTPTEATLVAMWERLLDVQPIGIDDDFFALGGHSLLAVRLISELERLSGRRLPVSSLLARRSVAQLAALLDDEMTARSSTPGLTGSCQLAVRLAEHASAADATPLFLIHPVGGNVLCYAALAERLAACAPVWAVQSRASAGGAPHASVAEMADAYIAAIRTVQPRGPYRLGGWSMGGLIAAEIAQRLAHAGDVVSRLVLLDSWELSPAQRELLLDRDVRRQRFLLELGRGGLGDSPAGELAATLERAFDAHLAALQSHRLVGRIPLAAPALVIRARHGAATEADVSRWRQVLDAVLSTEVGGDHHAVVGPPHVDDVARLVRAYLAGSVVPDIQLENRT